VGSHTPPANDDRQSRRPRFDALGYARVAQDPTPVEPRDILDPAYGSARALLRRLCDPAAMDHDSSRSQAFCELLQRASLLPLSAV